MNRYNYRAKEWVEHGIESFKNVTFKLNNIIVLSENTERSGSFYPVRDTCDMEGDPKEHCIFTDALFYNTTIRLSSNYDVIITNENSVIIDEMYPREKVDVLSRTALNCDKEYSY